MRARELFEDYKTAEQKFLKQDANPEFVKLILAKFRTLQPRMTGFERDIDWWAANKTFQQLVTFLDNLEGIPSQREMKKSRTGDSHNLYEDDSWLIVIPLDKDASCFHGKTTDWCTAKPFAAHYESYFYEQNTTLIYCVNKQNGKKWAIAVESGEQEDPGRIELFDANDSHIDGYTFEQQTGLDPDWIIEQAQGKVPVQRVAASRNIYREAVKKLEELLAIIPARKRNIDVEKLILLTKHQPSMNFYFRHVGKADYPRSLEKIAVAVNTDFLGYIRDPLDSTIKTALRQDPSSIQFVPEDRVDENMLTEAFMNGAKLYTLYKSFGYTPSVEILRQFVNREHTYSITPHIINIYSETNKNYPLPEDVMAADARKFPMTAIREYMAYIGTPPESMQIAAISSDYRVILKLEDVATERVYLEAIKRTPAVVQYIKNLTLEMVVEAIERSPYLFVNLSTRADRLERTESNTDLLRILRHRRVKDASIPLNDPYVAYESLAELISGDFLDDSDIQDARLVNKAVNQMKIDRYFKLIAPKLEQKYPKIFAYVENTR
jgi:hypothetical protein